jgi:hypothetical protein
MVITSQRGYCYGKRDPTANESKRLHQSSGEIAMITIIILE